MTSKTFDSKSSMIQVKICGLTVPDEAASCAEAGADAIGLVFFPKSPRNVDTDQAKAVVAALPESVATVGVFVDADYDTIMEKVENVNLSVVQLHGKETPDLAKRLALRGVTVIKALFVDGVPDLAAADAFHVNGYLVECSKGPLPGGNATVWDWASARDFGKKYPLVLAGGLSPDNVADAIADALPVAVDVSSGVEASPGRKDPEKVVRFIEAVRKCESTVPLHSRQRIFQPKSYSSSHMS